jgi:hypothetical protein
VSRVELSNQPSNWRETSEETNWDEKRAYRISARSVRRRRRGRDQRGRRGGGTCSGGVGAVR